MNVLIIPVTCGLLNVIRFLSSLKQNVLEFKYVLFIVELLFLVYMLNNPSLQLYVNNITRLFLVLERPA